MDATILMNLYSRLRTSKEVSDKGVELIQSIMKLFDNMDKICKTYEQGMQSEEWRKNFEQIAGTEGSKMAEELYQTFVAILKKVGYR